MADLSPAQTEAAKVWASSYEHLHNPTAPAKRRMWASDVARLAQRELSQHQIAVLNMVAGKGVRIQDLAVRTGRPAEDLAALFAGALRKLATALEAQAAAEGS